MEDPNKDLKGGGGTPSGADQLENNPTGSKDDKEATGATGASGASGATGATGPSDDQVTVSKSELEQLRKDAAEKESFRKGLIRLNKARGRNLPGSEPAKKKKVNDSDDDFDDEKINPDEFVTKIELALREENRAIDDACKNEKILLNWDEIIVFYQRPKENTYKTQSAAIQSAYKLWKADKGITEKSEEEEAKKKADKAKQDLSSDKGLSKGKDKKPVSKKRTIIPPKQKMENWYDKK